MIEARFVWLIIVGAVTAFVAIFGWSHNLLRSKMDQLSNEAMRRPTFDQTRRLIEDKLEAHEMAFVNLSKRLDEVRSQYQKTDEKLDRLLTLCIELKSNDRQDRR